MDERPTLENESQRLLTDIVGFLSRRKIGRRPPVLVGGWAVWSYTRYAMSIDIDLVLNSRDRHSLLQWLKEHQGMTVAKPHIDGWQGAEKYVAGTPRPLVVDMATYGERYPFHDRPERLDFNLVESHHTVTDWNGQSIRLPTRSLLILFKTKAAYDRGVRARQPEATPRVEEKWHKDQADILALLDPALAEQALEPAFLYKQIERLPFLRDTLSAIPRSEAAIQRANISRHEAEERIKGFLSLVR